MIKKGIIIAATLFVSAVGIKAMTYSRLSETEKVERITQKMSKKLNLTEEQEAQVFKINLKRSKGHQEAYEAGRKKEIIVAAVKQWEEDLKAVLTVEQANKLRLK